MDYRKTLNLPQTDFPMKANLAQKEPEMLAKWEEENLYAQIRGKSEGKQKYILHDGPPYANGDIHIGHALNKTLKDIIVKFKTMRGFDSPYIPGWDCHGLPVEHQLFKELGIQKTEIDQVIFRKKAYSYAMKYVEIQKKQFKRLGVFGEWQNPYLTLTPEYEYWILRSLSELVKKGFIYRGFKPVNWCFSCETALAEAEVEYEDHTSPSIYVKFKVKNPERITGLPYKDFNLVIWTTTPWTLIANVAVAVHPDFSYNIIEAGKEILVLEKGLCQRILEKCGIKDFKIIKEVTGRELNGLMYTHPFSAKDNCPVVTADYVTREEGTGLVHTAPGHGHEDHQTGVRYNLEIIMPVDNKGKFTCEAGEFFGMHVFTANEKIIERLKNKGALLFKGEISHSYPHCWRCKNPIIFRATRQWFMKIDVDFKSRLKEEINLVQWVPSAGKERISAMVDLRPDWCLSRQRYWGVPIPAIACKKCGTDFQLFADTIDYFAEIVLKEGSDAWFTKTIDELLPKNFSCPKCKTRDFIKSADILDVWFDSGVSHQAVLKEKQWLPASLYLEGSDQHRGWFQASLIPSTAIDGKAPFDAVLTHGFVVDGEGKKMSKSLGNVISPQDITKDYGADILRLWVASSDYNEDIRISKEILDRLIEAYRKIRNTTRFLLSNIYDFDPDKDKVAYEDMLKIDKWILFRLQATADSAKVSFENFDFASAYRIIYNFCNEILSNFYLDILKDRLYTFTNNSRARRSAQTALYEILNVLSRIIAPILVFTAEETWKYMPKEEKDKNTASIHLSEWPRENLLWLNDSLEKEFNEILDLRPLALKKIEDIRIKGEVGSSADCKLVFATSDQSRFEFLKQWQEDLREIFKVSQIDLKKVETLSPQSASGIKELEISAQKASGKKCVRCWNYRLDIGADKDHPEICNRCLETVKGGN